MNIFGWFVVVAGFGSLFWGACGGDDDEGGGSGADLVAICKETCAKVQSACFGIDAGGDSPICASTCPSDAGVCSNESEIVSARKACSANTTCEDLLRCTAAIPRCQSGSGGG
jgi:hypothetical protein